MTRTYTGSAPHRIRRIRSPDTIVVDYSPGRKTAPPPRAITIDGQRCEPTAVFDTFFVFVAKRYRAHRKRLAGSPQPWTDDPILQQYPFTNVFRVLDRVSQYVLRNVIQTGDGSRDEQCFRVMLFRSFNKIETWEALVEHFGPLTWGAFDVTAYEKFLVARMNTGVTLYGAAYIVPSPNLGGKSNAANHLRLMQLMMEDGLPAQLQRLRHLKDAHGRVSLFPGMGDFTALQLLLDLNMTPHFQYSEDEWVALGPGSLECIRKMFGVEVRGRELAALRYIHRTQHDHFVRLYTPPHDVPKIAGRPRGMSMVDIEHALCECEKYSRAYHPTIKGRRHQVSKRRFVPRPEPITDLVPEHWLDPELWRRQTDATPPPTIVRGEPVYEVSHIVMEKRGQNTVDPSYLVRWVGYGPDDDTWEKKSTLADGAVEVLEEWDSAKRRIHARMIGMRNMGDVYRA